MKKLMKKYVLGSLAAVGLFGVAGTASAGVVPIFLNEITTGTTSVFIYTINFTSNGSTESLTAGDFFTLYDVGSVSASSNNGSFTLSSALTGVTAPFITVPDSASILNATVTYSGGPITADTTFTETITFPGTLSTTIGYYSSTDSISSGKNSQGGLVIVPLIVVPEPTTYAALALGAVAAVGAFLRRRRTTL